MRTLLICLLILTFLFSCKTKTFVPIAEVKTQTKKAKRYFYVFETKENFDTIDKNYIIYTKMNVGSRRINLDCGSDELQEKYVLFKNDETSYIQKVAGSAVYYPAKLKSNDIINSFISSFSELKYEDVKDFRTLQNNMIIDHHSVYKEYIFVGEKNHPIMISFPEYYFKKEEADIKNANFDYNKNLKLFKIDSLLNSEIDELNKQNVFRFRKCRKE